MAKVIRSAVEQGITFFDTTEFYGPLTSEEYVNSVLGWRTVRAREVMQGQKVSVKL